MQNAVVGHDTEWRSDCPGEASFAHDVPSKLAMLPVADTTTHRVVEAHEMFWTGFVAVPSSTTASWPQVVPSKREATPAVLTEAQNVGETQDTWYWPPFGPVGAGPAAAGAVQADPSQVMASWPPSATQKVDDVHDTELRVLPACAGAGADHRDPFQNVASPDSSTAAQKEGVGHETP